MRDSIYNAFLECDKETGIYYIDDYIPMWRGGRKDNFSSMIISLKEKETQAIDYFANLLTPFLFWLNKDISSLDILMTHVPSSSSDNIHTGMFRLNQKISIFADDAVNSGEDLHTFYQSLDFFQRHTSIRSSHSGGNRDISNHMTSIKLDLHTDITRSNQKLNKEISELVQNPLLIIDDVTTSGSSLLACRKIAFKQGFREVFLLALGRTVRNDNE